jgi:signal peptidase
LLVPTSNYAALNATRSGFQFAGETLLPALSVSVLATYLCARGGFLPALAYHFGIVAFEWFSPILPHMEWTVEAFIGTTAPLVALMAARSAGADTAAKEAPPERFDVSAPWVVVAMVLVALLWFNTGLLGVQPQVVNGVSMEPSMHTGDMVIVKDVDVEDLKVDDIIQFRVGETRIFHRIIEVEQTPGGYVFVTQGDNNNTPDDPILEEQVEGKVVYTIPDIGWVPIKFNQFLYSLG